MSEVEELRAELAEIDARVEGARGIHRRNWVAERDLKIAEARLRKVEALADEYAANGAAREAAGLPAWPNNVARDIRAALAAEPAEDKWAREFCGHPSHGRYGHVCEPAEEAPALPTPETPDDALIEEWGVRYERKGDPTMDNPSGVITVEQRVANEETARQCVHVKAPISGTGHRVVRRLVSKWVEVQP